MPKGWTQARWKRNNLLNQSNLKPNWPRRKICRTTGRPCPTGAWRWTRTLRTAQARTTFSLPTRESCRIFCRERRGSLLKRRLRDNESRTRQIRFICSSLPNKRNRLLRPKRESTKHWFKTDLFTRKTSLKSMSTKISTSKFETVPFGSIGYYLRIYNRKYI